MGDTDASKTAAFDESGNNSHKFFYGWVMLPVTTLMFFCTAPGQTLSVMTFIEHLKEHLHLQSGEIGMIYTAATLCAALPITYIGMLMDKFGPRKVTTGVVLLFGLALMGLSTVNNILMLFIGFLLIRMLGQGSLSMLSQNTLAYWFNRRLGTMNAIRSQGMTLATAIVPTINIFLIAHYGWQRSFIFLGTAVWALLLPCLAFLFRNKPEDIGQFPDGERITKKDYEQRRQVMAYNEPDFTLREAMRTRSYWIMLASLALWAMMMTGFIFHGVALFEAHGLEEKYTGLMTFAMSFPLIISQLGGGHLADKISMNYLLSISMGLFALAYGIFMFTYSPFMVVLFAVFLGVSQGLLTSLAGPYWVRYYGRLNLGKIQGSVTTVIVAASSLGSAVVGLCLDYFKNDTVAMILFVCLPLPLVILGLLATKPPLPVREAAQ